MAYDLPGNVLAYLGTNYSNPETVGSTFGIGTSADLKRRRALLLAKLMQQGKINQAQLSPDDLSIAAPQLGTVHHQGGGIGGALGGILGGVGGFFSNLGGDVATATKGAGPAVAGLLGSLGHDILHPYFLHPTNRLGLSNVGGQEQFSENVVKPLAQQYGYTYLGQGAPKGSTLWSRIYQHPLGPIMDVASVASLGLGSAARGTAALARAGAVSDEGRAFKALVSSAREPLIPGELPKSRVAAGETAMPLSREYSTRPLRRILQYATDKAAKIPGIGKPIGALQSRLAMTQRLRGEYSTKELQGNMAASREAIEPLVPKLKDLTPDEVAAIPLIGMRINSPRLISLYQRAVGEGIEGVAPKGQNVPAHMAEKVPQLPESRAKLPARTKELVQDPTKSPKLMGFLKTYTERLQSRMYPDVGEAEKLDEYINLPRRKLLERFGQEEPTLPKGAPPHPFEKGFLVPTDVSGSVKYAEPGRLGRMMGRQAGLQVGKRGTFNPSSMGLQDVFRTPYMGMRPDPDAVLAGVTRPDARQFVDFLSKHERDKIESAYNEDTVFAQAVKDKNGAPVQVDGKMSVKEVQDEFGPDFVPVNPAIPWQFYNKEFTVGQAAEKMHTMGFDTTEIMARMGAEAEDTALEVTLAAQRTPNVVVPRKFAEYQLGLATAHTPYKYGAARFAARAMNVWRTHTLTFMPRWALNTGVGSFVLATIKGISPRQYAMAQRLRSFVGDEAKLRLRPGEKGLFDRPELAGVNLASIGSWDMLEMGALGHVDPLDFKTGVVTRNIMRRVQQIEDHFRRASFVQSLDKRTRQLMNEQGVIISNVEKAKGPRTVEEYVNYIMDNPELVQHAIEDLNKFSYNFATLGPAERRYVRQIIPFWGWYKFISTLAYRLPVEYPGRTAILAHLGTLGASQVRQKYGDVPSWLTGAIPLTSGTKGFQYLSTMGLNPFSQIFNPKGPEGTVSGIVQLGQGSPLIQTLLAGYGLDTLRGGEVPISPQTLQQAGVGHDFWGSLVGQAGTPQAGQDFSISQLASGKRWLAALIRSFPQARIAERQMTGGRSVYPESLPWALRPMATKPESRFGGTLSDVLEQVVGVAPRPYDLQGWQRLGRKRALYARTKQRHDLQNLRQNLSK